MTPEASLFFFIKKNHLPILLITWVILAIVINPIGEFPFNDDWAYAESVKILVETRTYFMSAYVSTNLFAQVLWGALFCLPFGFSFTAVRLSTLVAGLLGLWGTHRLLYTATESRQTAFIGTALLLVNPMYWGLSASFMTDVPFYTLMVWSLAFLIIGLKRDTQQPILIGLGLAVIALLIRQFAMAIFVGFGFIYVVRKGIHLKSLGVAFLSVALGLITQMIYQRWLLYVIPVNVHYNVQATNFFQRSFYKWQLIHDFLHNTFVTLMYTGVFIFPYFLTLLTKNSRNSFRRNLWLLLGLTSLIIGFWFYFFDGAIMPLWFNTLNAFGIGPLLVRDVYFNLYHLPLPSFLHFLMVCVTIGSLAGSVGILFFLVKLVMYLLQRPKATELNRWSVALFLLVVSGIYYFPIGMHIVFDRYLLPLPVLLISLIYLTRPLLASQPTAVPLRWPIYATTGLLVVYLIFSIGAVHDYMSWNRVRWQALRGLMKQGIKPTQIDGGLEFNGWYLYNGAYEPTPDKSWWWVDQDTYVLGTSILPGYQSFQQHPVDTWFPWGIQTIFIGKKK